MTSSSTWYSTDAASWWNKDEDDIDDDNPYKGQENERDCTVFVIDCSQSMFSKMKIKTEKAENSDHKMDIDDAKTEDLIFTNVCKAIENTLKRKIIKSSDDVVSFLLYNTLEHKNGLNLPNVYLLSTPDCPSAKIIKEIRDLPVTFAHSFHSLKRESKQCDFRDLLWIVQTIFSSEDSKGTKYGSKRAFIFTDNDCPQYKDLNATVAKAGDMLNDGIEINVFPLADNFKIKTFYGNICTFNLDELSTEAQFKEFCPSLEDLENDLRVKEMKKRCLTSCPFTIGPNFKMAVSMYSLYRRATKESPQWLDARTNQPLTTHTRWVCADTGQILDLDTQVRTYHEYGPMKDRVFFTKAEMKQIKTFGEPELTLMGFKPLHRLKPYYQYRTSAFLYPNEQRCHGSNVAFNALISAMHSLQQFAVCRFVLRKQSPPRFVALVAQMETVDSQNQDKQLEPPGMNMIYLPYADDIRKIDIDGQESMKRCDSKEDDVLIEKAKKIIDKLTLNEAYTPTNPVLQKHYDALEALALEQLGNDDSNENVLFEDDIQPADEDMIDAADEEINEFLRVIGDKCGAEEERSVKKKRGRAGEGGGNKRKAKKRKVDLPTDVADYDWKKLSENDELKSLKVKDLKVYLSNNGLKMSGKKAELIERIKAHIE